MAWKKPSPELSSILEKALKGMEARNKPMFGCPAYFVGDNWFSGVHEDRLLVRLNEKDREKMWAQHPDAQLFEPMPGRVMKEFVVLPPAVVDDTKELKKWLKLGHAYSATLPPKKKKKAKKKAGAKAVPKKPANASKKRS
jgi:TfoX/Sxy family transcriptional regulator of competence genes